jgi:hypothetical protein
VQRPDSLRDPHPAQYHQECSDDPQDPHIAPSSLATPDTMELSTASYAVGWPKVHESLNCARQTRFGAVAAKPGGERGAARGLALPALREQLRYEAGHRRRQAGAGAWRSRPGRRTHHR